MKLIIVCTRYMGMAKIDKVIQAFSLALIVMVGVSIVFTVSLFFLAPTLGNMIGAGTNSRIAGGLSTLKTALKALWFKQNRGTFLL